MAKKPSAKNKTGKHASSGNSRPAAATPHVTSSDQRCYTIADWRLEKPEFKIEQQHDGDQVRYIVHGDLTREVPPIRDSKYLSREQHIEIYRWMLLNRRM